MGDLHLMAPLGRCTQRCINCRDDGNCSTIIPSSSRSDDDRFTSGNHPIILEYHRIRPRQHYCQGGNAIRPPQPWQGLHQAVSASCSSRQLITTVSAKCKPVSLPDSNNQPKTVAPALRRVLALTSARVCVDRTLLVHPKPKIAGKIIIILQHCFLLPIPITIQYK